MAECVPTPWMLSVTETSSSRPSSSALCTLCISVGGLKTSSFTAVAHSSMCNAATHMPQVSCHFSAPVSLSLQALMRHQEASAGPVHLHAQLHAGSAFSSAPILSMRQLQLLVGIIYQADDSPVLLSLLTTWPGCQSSIAHSYHKKQHAVMKTPTGGFPPSGLVYSAVW